MKKKQLLKFNKDIIQYLILYHIKDNPYITQRECGLLVNRAVSVINQALSQYEQDGLIQKKYHTTKTIFYYLTPTGEKQLASLQVLYLQSIMEINQLVMAQFSSFEKQIKDNTIRFVLLVGEKVDINLLEYFLPKIGTSLKVESSIVLNNEKENIHILSKKLNAYHYDAILTTKRNFQDEKWKFVYEALQEKIRVIIFE